jgi:hypothetical protein
VEDERGAGGAERLDQRRRDDDARMAAEAIERGAPSVAAGPADAVGVVNVEVQSLVATEELAQLVEGRDVAVHAVDAVGEVPDVLIARAAFQRGAEGREVIVGHRLDRRELDRHRAGPGHDT